MFQLVCARCRPAIHALWLLLVILMTTSCSGGDIEPGISRELAKQRAASLADIRYTLRFWIPEDPDQPARGSVSIDFVLLNDALPLQLDFRGGKANLQRVACNGRVTRYRYRNEHLVVPASTLRLGPNRLAIDFLVDQDALNRQPEFLYTLFVPDRARLAFPLFEQPDLKATYELSLDLPAGWVAVSAATAAQIKPRENRVEYRFLPSDPVSPYAFSFVAGRFQAETRALEGRTMTLYHRETDRERVARNMDAIFQLHADALAWMEDYTGIPYPFRKFDFVLLPDFPFGGMEHVGAIQYRDSSLLLDEAPAETELLNRAQLIAHETAHMWFGNLVTMRWFNDVWTKEVFARLMAAKMVNPGFPDTDHELLFLLDHHPPAYAVDRSEAPNAIRQRLTNLNQAGQMYGPVIYHKAPIMMRQLELIVGADAFRAGLQEYLQEFAYGNASWPELIDLLDERTGADLDDWSQVWVNTPGRPVFGPERGVDTAPLLVAYDPAGRNRVWPQQFEVLTVGAGETAGDIVMATESRVPLPDTTRAGQLLYNADGYGYGLFPVDPALFEAWSWLTDLQRGALLVAAYESLLAGNGPAAADYFLLLLERIRQESNPLLLALELGQLSSVYRSLLPPSALRRQQLESTLWETMQAQPDAARVKVLFMAYAALAGSPDRLQQVYAIWAGETTVDRLALTEEDRIALAEALAIGLPGASQAIITRQLVETENPDRRRRLEFVAPSLSPDPEVRDAFFRSLTDPANRRNEPWVLDALRNLHHPARLATSEKYLLPSLELLEEIQETGDIFFPSNWLQASLGNYRSASAERTVRQFLAERPEYNRQLRMKILQAADPLFTAVRLQADTP